MCKTELHTTYIKLKFCEKATNFDAIKYVMSKKEGDFVKFCGLPRLYKLYKKCGRGRSIL